MHYLFNDFELFSSSLIEVECGVGEDSPDEGHGHVDPDEGCILAELVGDGEADPVGGLSETERRVQTGTRSCAQDVAGKEHVHQSQTLDQP